MLEWSSKKQAEWCMLYNVSMDLEWDVACAHGEVFGTSKRPVGRPIGTFHLKHSVGIDSRSHFPCQVRSDHYNLRAWVNDARFRDLATDLDINLPQGQRVGWLPEAGRVGTLAGFIVGDRARCFLEAGSLDTSHPELLDQILLD